MELSAPQAGTATEPQIRHQSDIRSNAVYCSIRDRIQDGSLKPGDQIIPTRELPRQFGISHATALAGLRQLQREGFVVSRQGAGTYIAESTAGVLGRANTKSVSVINSVSPLNELFYRPLIAALYEQLSALGAEYEMFGDPDRALSWDALPDDSADVTIWIRPALRPPVKPPEQRFTVLVSHDIEFISAKADGYDIVGVDYEQGGAIAAKYLREIGCNTVAILAVRSPMHSDQPGPLGAKRIHGFETVWGEPISSSPIMTKGASALQGAQAAAEFLKLRPMPEAVFAICDPIASGFCHGIKAHGLEPGKDVKVVGFNAQPPIYEEDSQLTSVEVPMESLGRTAAMVALERTDNRNGLARKIQLACGLRKGETA